MSSVPRTLLSSLTLNRILSVPAVLALVWVLSSVIRYSLAAPPSFDGAMNLNTAASFLRGEGYGFFYDIFFPFPAQTDGPFVLPAALAMWLGGVTPFTVQVVNLGYVVAFSFLGFTVFRRFDLPAWLSVGGVLALLATPGFMDYGMNGYGEVPVMVWYFAGLLVLGKSLGEGDGADKSCIAAGVLFGLAYLTKIVALIVVAPTLVVYFLLIVRRPFAVRRLIALGAGFVAPVAIWEVFRFVELGGASGFSQWWSLQLGQVFSQSGVRHAGEARGLVEKGVAHYSALGSFLGLPAVVLAFYLVVPLGFALVRTGAAVVSLERRLYLGSMAVGGVLYLVWWLFVTPSAMAWLRRILDGILILQCLSVIMVWEVFRAFRKASTGEGSRRVGRAWCVLIFVIPVLVGQIFLVGKGELATRVASGPPDSSGNFALARTMAALPADAIIFGTGWWKAPVLALFSGRDIHNFQRWLAGDINALPRKFFVVDSYAKQLAEDEVSNVLALTEHKLISESEAGALYEILHVRDYLPFPAGDEAVSSLSAEVDFSKGDYPFKRGFYGVERGKVSWMRPNGAVLLRRAGEDRLGISVVVPAKILGAHPESPTRLRVRADGCVDEAVELLRAGSQQFEFSVNCPPGDQPKPFLLTMSIDRHLPAVRQIDADNRLLAILMQSVKLREGVQ